MIKVQKSRGEIAAKFFHRAIEAKIFNCSRRHETPGATYEFLKSRLDPFDRAVMETITSDDIHSLSHLAALDASPSSSSRI